MSLREKSAKWLRWLQRADPSEIVATAVLSLATVVSAWCGYQSALWSGIQTFDLHDASHIERRAAQYDIHADQLRTIDVALFVQYLIAEVQRETALADFLRGRFRPEAKVAVDAWLATDPGTNPDAPAHPFLMPEYHIAQAEQARALRVEAGDKYQAAETANRHSDNYVLMTVLFTTVLFFTGICTKLPGRLMQRATFALGVILFVSGLIILLWFPVTWG